MLPSPAVTEVYSTSDNGRDSGLELALVTHRSKWSPSLTVLLLLHPVMSTHVETKAGPKRNVHTRHTLNIGPGFFYQIQGTANILLEQFKVHASTGLLLVPHSAVVLPTARNSDKLVSNELNPAPSLTHNGRWTKQDNHLHSTVNAWKTSRTIVTIPRPTRSDHTTPCTIMQGCVTTGHEVFTHISLFATDILSQAQAAHRRRSATALPDCQRHGLWGCNGMREEPGDLVTIYLPSPRCINSHDVETKSTTNRYVGTQ
jgi:hypothetical protein